MNFLSSLAYLWSFVARKHWLFGGIYDPHPDMVEGGCFGIPNQFGRQRHSGVAAARRQARKARNQRRGRA